MPDSRSNAAARPHRGPEAEPQPPELVAVFAILAQQHRTMKEMLERLLAAADSERAALWVRVRRELVSHERSEVRELYPVLRMSPESAALADGHDAEARELEQIIGTLDRIPPALDTWRLLATRLAETVVAHATEEEHEIFPEAQRVLGEARAVELAGPVLDAKQKLAEQL